MKKGRDWTVPLIGGASGTGKSSVANKLAKFYGVNAMELDDIGQAVGAVTTGEALPAYHHCDTDLDWLEMSIADNADWLGRVCRELAPALRAVIIEGDFIDPAFAADFPHPAVQALFIRESERDQIARNFRAREGGEPQTFRADISVPYGQRLAEACGKPGIPVAEGRPWDTALDRIINP